MMDQFSIIKYSNLPADLKAKFNKSLAREMLVLKDEIIKDDILGSFAINEFVASLGECASASFLVSDLYSKISAGIQVGSGDQRLFHNILFAITKSWSEMNKLN
jgi:hypothetical protein